MQGFAAITRGFTAIKSAAQDLPLQTASKSIRLDMEDAMERWEGGGG